MQLRSREALIQCLEIARVSERELARRAGLGHATVNHLITGRRRTCSLATARAIERALEIGEGTLFKSDIDTPPGPR
jgi:transcriptional regulator with XRE-family HTH domain